MPYKQMKEYDSRGIKESVNILMAMHCGPMLRGLRNEVILSVENRLMKEMISQLQDTPYGYLILNRGKKKCLVMLYHIERFCRYISQKEIIEALDRFGYGLSEEKSPEENMIRALFGIAQAMSEYYAGRKEFPHELGYILEYPLHDVEMFIKNQGQNSLMTGYWKVYDNLEKAKETFKKYDQVREQAIADVMAGKMFYELAI